MKVLVTGSDGLLGSNIVRCLLDYGYNVRAFCQQGKPTPTLDGLPIERTYGDILDAESLAKAVKGCSIIIHAAANTSVWPSRSLKVRDVNLQGTQNAIQAAIRFQVDRFVYIGTANSFSPGTKEAPGDETTPFICGKYHLDYIDSKYAARQIVLKAIEELNLPALTINPTFMIGPYDSTPSSGMMLIKLYQGRIPGYTSGGKCWTHARDVAVAVVNSLTKGRIGESYIAGNENLDYGEFFQLAAKTIGVAPPRFKMATPLVKATGALASLTAAITGKPPLLSYAMARVGCDGHYYDPTKARTQLDLPATPLEQAVRESFEWLSTNGYVDCRR
jgi:dihydroflavonol-4-reductase